MIIFVYLVMCNYLCSAEDPPIINIDTYFDNAEELLLDIPIRNAIWSHRVKQKMVFNVNARPTFKEDSLQIAREFCEIIEAGETPPVAVFLGEFPMASPMIQSICTRLNLPFIQINWRHMRSFRGGRNALNFYPEPQLLSQGLATIVRSLDWDDFVLLYENENGLIRLQEVLKYDWDPKDGELDWVFLRQLGDDRRTVLKTIKDLKVNQFILDCETSNIIDILLEAQEFKLMEYYHSYLITSFDADTLDFSRLNTSANITTVKLVNHESENIKQILQDWERTEFRNGRKITFKPIMVNTETILLHDAMNSLFDAINEVKDENFNTKNLSCSDGDEFPHGSDIISTIKFNVMEKRDMLSGPIEFDESGRRIDFDIYVVDKFDGKIVGTWNAKRPNDIQIYRSPDEDEKAFEERSKKNIFIVTTRVLEPYVMLKTAAWDEKLVGNDRFQGFAIDLMLELGKMLNYTFVFELNDRTGRYVDELGTWDGMIGDVMNYRASFAVGDLTITPERKRVVDFSVPFMSLGIGLLMQDPSSENKMFAFLKPFTTQVWFYTATLYLISSVVVWLLARMCPSDWQYPHPCDFHSKELENIWSFKNCLFLCLGTIMNQGCDDYPKGVSSRIGLGAWWLFALIMTNSYTASLSAFLTKEQQNEIKDFESLAKQNRIKYGMYEGGSTEMFLKNSSYPVYRKMYNTMKTAEPPVMQKSNEEGVNRVKSTKNGEYAFLMESTNIEYEVETNCNLKEVGNWLQPQSYGIAMEQNSRHRKKMNAMILELQANGKLLALKDKWWKEKRKEPSCPPKVKTGSGGLDLNEVGGVFVVLGVGVGLAWIFGAIEFLWNVRHVSIEQHITYWKAFKIEFIFSLKFWITEKRIVPEISEASSCTDDGENDRLSIARSFLQGATSILNINNVTADPGPSANKRK